MSASLRINDRDPLASREGLSLRDALREAGIMLPSACGGRGLCGMCRVRVADCSQPLAEEEVKRLTAQERESGWRLACRVAMDGEVRVLLDEEALNAPSREARVAAVTDLNRDTKRFTLAFWGDPFKFRAGQYVQLEIPPQVESGEPAYRAYSIASDPAEPWSIDLIVRRVADGLGTSFLHDRVRVGDTITFSGPHGLFRLRPTPNPAIFVAGGSGIAPFQSMLREAGATNPEKPVTLIFGGVNPGDLYDLDLLASLGSRLRNFTLIPALSNAPPDGGWTGERGLVTEVIAGLPGDLSQAEGYLCGSPGMIGACVSALKARGVAESRIFFDRFG